MMTPKPEEQLGGKRLHMGKTEPIEILARPSIRGCIKTLRTKST